MPDTTEATKIEKIGGKETFMPTSLVLFLGDLQKKAFKLSNTLNYLIYRLLTVFHQNSLLNIAIIKLEKVNGLINYEGLDPEVLTTGEKFLVAELYLHMSDYDSACKYFEDTILDDYDPKWFTHYKYAFSEEIHK